MPISAGVCPVGFLPPRIMLKQRLRNRAIGWELDFDVFVGDVIEGECGVVVCHERRPFWYEGASLGGHGLWDC